MVIGVLGRLSVVNRSHDHSDEVRPIDSSTKDSLHAYTAIPDTHDNTMTLNRENPAQQFIDNIEEPILYFGCGTMRM